MGPLKLPTLLAVTNNPAIRFWIKKHLDEEFFIIDAAKKKDALSAAQNAMLDFIIIDSSFEDCDALELCRELHQMLRMLVPILLITGSLKRSFLDLALDAGVNDFLNHRLDPEELHTRIATIRQNQYLREKTQEASNALIQKKEDISKNYLKNRILLHNQVIQLLEEAKKEKASIAALIIRIDHFNELQSQIGYLVSEQILIPFAHLIQQFLAKSDLLIPSEPGRTIVLLKDSTPVNGRVLAERIRTAILQTAFQTDAGPIHLTVSIVVSPLEATEDDFNKMIDSASKALKTVQNLIISLHQ
ncbi:MAG TPA: diguanylate cyclase [Chlamydiales bacterium]|nr:diguanylate cyclase [Chlamydiales bacterium]